MMGDVVKELAEAIDQRRAELGMDVQALSDASGVTRQGLAPLLAGERRRYQDRLKFPVCRALGWSPDSIDRLLRGEPPVVEVANPRPGDVRYATMAMAEDGIRQLGDLTAKVERLEAQVAELRTLLDRREQHG